MSLMKEQVSIHNIHVIDIDVSSVFRHQNSEVRFQEGLHKSPFILLTYCIYLNHLNPPKKSFSFPLKVCVFSLLVLCVKPQDFAQQKKSESEPVEQLGWNEDFPGRPWPPSAISRPKKKFQWPKLWPNWYPPGNISPAVWYMFWVDDFPAFCFGGMY